MTEINPNILPPGMRDKKLSFEDRFPNFSSVPDYLIDQAYDAGPRTGLDAWYRNTISGSGARIQELAGREDVTWDPIKQAMVWPDGSRVLKQGFGSLLNRGSEMGMSDLDIIKARRAMQRQELLGAKLPHDRILGVSDEGELTGKKDITNKSVRQRLREVRGIHPEAKKGGNRGLDVRTDYYGLVNELTAEEKLKDLTTALTKRKVDISGMENDPVRLESLLEETGVIAGEKKAFKKSQRDAAARNAARGLSPQAMDGLDPQRGAARVQQRGSGSNNSGGFQMPANLLDDPSLPATERERRSLLRDKIESQQIASDVTFYSKPNRYNRALTAQAEATRLYERKVDYLRDLERQEATHQYNRDLAKMQHEQRQFEIREQNKMLRERYEHELEIEEKRRAEADFDNLTRMIMGMAGSL